MEHVTAREIAPYLMDDAVLAQLANCGNRHAAVRFNLFDWLITPAYAQDDDSCSIKLGPDGSTVLMTPDFAKTCYESGLAAREAGGFAGQKDNLEAQLPKIHDAFPQPGVPLGGKAPSYTTRQLQHEFKHASDFGVSGGWNKANGAAFQKAIDGHIADSATTVIQGTYRGQPVTHYFNPTTGNNVFIRPDGSFLGGLETQSRSDH